MRSVSCLGESEKRHWELKGPVWMRGKRVGLNSLNWLSLVDVLSDSLAYLWERTSLELVTEFVGMEMDTSLLQVVVAGVMLEELGPKDSRSRLRTESVMVLPMLFCLRN